MAALGVLEQVELADDAALSAMRSVIAGVDWSKLELSPTAWKALVLLAYRAVRPADDVNRAGGGIYSPDLRDDAQTQRSAIVSRLSALPGEDAYRALIQLSEHPTVAPHGDYFRSVARSRAEQDAEPAAWDLAQLHEFLRRGTLRPSTAEQLFELVMDRLGGAAHDLEDGDFSCRELLAPKAHERLVQKYLAYVLHLGAREHYSVAREEEVFLGKMPDIRLHGNFGDPHPVISIEIKIADNWPKMALLEAALRDQSVGQYLRDTRSRHGILVLLRKARMRWTDAASGSLSFEAVCERLANQAAALSGGGLTVRVVSIDVRPESGKGAQQEAKRGRAGSRGTGVTEGRKRRPTQAVASEAPASE